MNLSPEARRAAKRIVTAHAARDIAPIIATAFGATAAAPVVPPTMPPPYGPSFGGDYSAGYDAAFSGGYSAAMYPSMPPPPLAAMAPTQPLGGAPTAGIGAAAASAAQATIVPPPTSGPSASGPLSGPLPSSALPRYAMSHMLPPSSAAPSTAPVSAGYVPPATLASNLLTAPPGPAASATGASDAEMNAPSAWKASAGDRAVYKVRPCCRFSRPCVRALGANLLLARPLARLLQAWFKRMRSRTPSVVHDLSLSPRAATAEEERGAGVSLADTLRLLRRSHLTDSTLQALRRLIRQAYFLLYAPPEHRMAVARSGGAVETPPGAASADWSRSAAPRAGLPPADTRMPWQIPDCDGAWVPAAAADAGAAACSLARHLRTHGRTQSCCPRTCSWPAYTSPACSGARARRRPRACRCRCSRSLAARACWVLSPPAPAAQRAPPCLRLPPALPARLPALLPASAQAWASAAAA